MRRCPQCAAVAEDDKKFCRKCGAKLNEPEPEVPRVEPQPAVSPPWPPTRARATGAVSRHRVPTRALAGAVIVLLAGLATAGIVLSRRGATARPAAPEAPLPLASATTAGEATSGGTFWQLTGFSGAVQGISGVAALAVNASDHLFAAVQGGNVGTTGFFRSTDNGNTWVPINNGLANTNADGVTVSANGTVLAATHGAGVFRSTDNGDSWLRTSFPGSTSNGMYTFGNSIYVLDGFFCTGLYRSRDDGVTWITINNGLATCVNGVAVNQSGQLFAATGTSGAFRSTNDGASWSPINTGLGTPDLSRIFVTPNGDVYAGGAGGVYRSADNGSSWTTVNNGLPTPRTLLGVNSRGHVFVGLTGAPGVYVSVDNGASWSPLRSGLGVNAIGATVVFQSTGHPFVTDGLQIWRGGYITTGASANPRQRGPSFDCSQATTPVERMICSDQELSDLDNQLADAYVSTLRRSAVPASIRERQRAWIAERGQCTTRDCAMALYRQRIDELRQE